MARKPEAVRQNIGYMSQKFSLYNDLKVIENLRLFAGLYSVPSQRAAGTHRLGARNGEPEGPGESDHRHAARRMEAAAGAGLRGAAPAAHHLSRRADFRRRSHFAAPVLGPDSPDGGRGRDGVCDHALHGRSRILQPAGADLSRQDGRAGHAVRAEAELDERRTAAGGVRAAGHCGGGAAIGARSDGCRGLRQRAAPGGARMRTAAMPQIRRLSCGARHRTSAASRRFGPVWKMFSFRSPRTRSAEEERTA